MIARILVEITNRSVDKTFTYLIPNHLQDKIQVGVRVLVPFATFKLEGFVLEISNQTEEFELKEIIDVIDSEVILTPELLKLGKYISERTLSTLISAYQAMLPTGYKAKKNKKINIKYETYVSLNTKNLDKLMLTSKQEEIIKLLENNEELTYTYLKKVNASVDTLLKKGILKKEKKEIYRLQDEVLETKKYSLTKLQEKVFQEVDIDNYKTYLLYGVTGSGKTEVYMELISKVLEKGKNAIVLIPEISLTPQTVSRFKRRFGSIIAVLHSGLSDSEKYDEYRKIKRQEIRIVIGARSAIFAPLTNIGIIIVDEEHSNSYKQDNMPRYDAIDIAKWRGEYHKAPVILGSATPTLESYARGLKGVYKLLVLDKRVYNQELPKILIVDMFKSKKKSKFCSELLYNKIQETLDNNCQVILFLNKRGYSSVVTCSNCGYTFTCPNCQVTLTYHKTSDMLRCHYCGYARKREMKCPNCSSLELTNSGIGTEAVVEDLNNLFPTAKVVRMDLDTTTKKGSHEKIINDFKNKKYEILVGTQMIAKGLDFQDVTLVGVINADNSLNIPDYRSAEVTFDILEQVAGRSGRGLKEGRVIIQTYNPSHYAITYASKNDYVGFFYEEMKNRKILGYPPYYYFVLVRIKSKNYELLSQEVKKIKEYLASHLKFDILGPTLASPFKLNLVYRFNIIIKYKQEENLYSVLENLLEHYKNNSKIIIDIDFNPRSF